MEIKVGSIVTLEPTATYYDGRIIPSWVKKDKWYVAELHGDRAVINDNVSGTHHIQSAINIKNLHISK